MSDSISRQAAIDVLRRKMDKTAKGEIGAFYNTIIRQDIECIEQLPSAERRGRWVDVEPAPHNLFYATCSVCGDRQTIEVANYCPMCGASMNRKSKCVECKGGYCEDECQMGKAENK